MMRRFRQCVRAIASKWSLGGSLSFPQKTWRGIATEQPATGPFLIPHSNGWVRNRPERPSVRLKRAFAVSLRD